LELKLKQLIDLAQSGKTEPGLDRDAVYQDPIGRIAPKEYGADWLAAFEPVGDTGWIAVVQERRLEALRPIEVMRDGMIANALMAMVVAGGLIVLLLYFVKRGLSDRGLRFGGTLTTSSRTSSGDSLSARSERKSET